MITRTVDTLLVGNERVAFELRRSSRRRTLAIEVHPDLSVVVRAPARCPPREIEAWLAGRERWIGRQLERFRRLGRERAPPPAYVSGATHLYMGEPHRLEIVAAQKPGVTRVTGTLRVALPGGSAPERARRALEGWYRAQALEEFGAVLVQRFVPFAARGHALPTLTVRAMRTRWGSLVAPRTAGPGAGRQPARMTLNLALIRAPRECIEYVVAHELCHLENRGHGVRFHALMDRLMPDWCERRRRLQGLPLP